MKAPNDYIYYGARRSRHGVKRSMRIDPYTNDTNDTIK